MAIIDRLKLRLDNIGDSKDALLSEIIDTVTERMQIRFFGGEAVPKSLEYVIVEVAAVRYNRIASEGMSSQTVEGESITFDDSDDFSPFLSDISAYQRDEGRKGQIRFL